MKKWQIIVLLLIACSALSLGQSLPQNAENEFLSAHGIEDINDIFTLVEDLILPPVYYGILEIETAHPNRSDRSLKMESYYSKEHGTFMEFTDPARQRGIRILQRDNTLWLYNPRSGSQRPVRLSPEDSFQGSVFSNNDLADPQYSRDYRAEILEFAETTHPVLGNITTVVIQGTALHSSAPYGKIVMTIETDRLLPLQTSYYARSGLLFKQTEFESFGEMAGRFRPLSFIMHSLEVDGFYSRVTIHTLEARQSIEEWRFNEAALTRR